jgi:cytochrome c oxidase cbb3-type subunit 3
MSEHPQDPLLLDHEYDGIRELDNKLPRWWVWLFNITIAFAVVYLLYYHVLRLGPLSAEEYKNEMKIGEHLKAGAMGAFEKGIPMLQPSTDPLVLNVGRALYAQSCAPCHRADGGGLVGPNLTDDYWIHGSNYTDTVSVIWNGVPAKGHLEDRPEAGANPGRRQLHLHAARGQTGHARQTAGKPGPGEDRAVGV